MLQSGQEKKYILQPRERFELSTPGLQDQRSNHWANEAGTLAEVFHLRCFEPVLVCLRF